MNNLKNVQEAMSYPAVRGVQAQCEYYVSMVELGAVARLLVFDDKDIVPPQQRAQRRPASGQAQHPQMRAATGRSAVEVFGVQKWVLQRPRCHHQHPHLVQEE